MSAQWTVKLWLGSYSWTIHDNDTGGYGPASPLKIAATLPSSDLAPLVNYNAETASFPVIVAQASDLGNLSLGDPVTIRYFAGRTPAAGDAPLVEFAGRVSSLVAKPHKLGVLYEVSCVDYTADLGEPPVGAVAYPAESGDARVKRILTEAGFGVGVGDALYGGPGSVPNNAALAARAIGVTSCLELLTHTMTETYWQIGAGVASAFRVEQNTTPAWRSASFSSGPYVLSPTLPFRLLPVQRSPGYSAPARVVLTAGVYKITLTTSFPGAAGVFVIDGGRVDRDVTFQQRKGDAASAVAVTSPTLPTFVASYPGATLWTTVDTELVNANDALNLANLYLPPAPPAAGALWVADTVRWELDAEPGAWVWPFLTRALAVANVQLKWSPVQREWYVGLVSGRTFILEDGAPYAEIDLIPWNVDFATATNPVKWSDLAAGMTYANMSTRDTFTDYGLAGI